MLLSESKVQEGIVALGDDHGKGRKKQQRYSHRLQHSSGGQKAGRKAAAQKLLPGDACQRGGRKEEEIVLEIVDGIGVRQRCGGKTEHDAQMVQTCT